MEKKKLAAITAMITMTVALGACGSANDTSSSGATDSTSAVSSTTFNTDTNTITDTNTSSGTDGSTPQAANDGRTGTPPQGTPPAGGPPEGTPPEGTPPEGAPPEGEGNPPSRPNGDQASADSYASSSTSGAADTESTTGQ